MTREHDDGLSNPVRLLAEAAEEIGASEQSGHFSERTIQAATTQEPILPPEYNLPETLYAMLTDGEMDPISNTSGLSPEYLAQGLEILLSDGARRKLSDEDRVFFNPPLSPLKRSNAISGTSTVPLHWHSSRQERSRLSSPRFISSYIRCCRYLTRLSIPRNVSCDCGRLGLGTAPGTPSDEVLLLAQVQR